jgi:plasmid stabilization system protein ParE
MRPVIFGPAARTELLEAFDWYEAHAPGLGEQFVAEIDAAVARIAANPLQFPSALRDVRRARLHRFPYALFFRIDDPEIHVFACFHSNRDPKRWQTRSRA